ncbi:MAG: sucrase ferredoxin [Actinobacteria bacterium]|nr:sucrase ferredoxin [Actinomycetota bacterium]
MSERFSCSRAARTRAEPLLATASRIRRWIALEQPGAWGHDAVIDSRLQPAIGGELRRRARQVDARLIVIRRHGRAADDGAAVTCFVAHSTPRACWVEQLTFDDAAGLLDHDLSPLAAGRSVGGRAVSRGPYLVCTNGAHDPCCAEFGRPLAAALSVARPAETWECSHIGGDRFAGNLVILPEGLYFGWVSPTDAPEVIERYEAGTIDLAHYRGRSCYPFAVQAAETFIRDRLGLTAVGALRAIGRGRVDGDLHEITFATIDGRRVAATVRARPDPEAWRLTCRAAGRMCPLRYELVDLNVPMTGSSGR